MSEKTILVWFRNDLRIHDNEILLEATRKANKVLPVYCFDPFYFKTTDYGLQKTGSIRAKFLIESVADLRQNLRKIGSELIVRIGHPAEIIPQLAQQYQVCEVYHHREVAFQETTISEEVEAALWKIKLNLKHFIGHTLYHKEDLPFPIKDIPNSFATFKKKIERDSKVRPCVETPLLIDTPAIDDAGALPTLTELGLPEPIADGRAVFEYCGGETAAMRQLAEYLTAIDVVNRQKGGRNAIMPNSRLSAWLSMGCISQKQLYWAMVNHEDGLHHSGSPLILELLWRDYFRFMFKKFGRQFFKPEGFKEEAPLIAPDEHVVFELWKGGHTGVPIVDAAMHKLNATGYINNHCRQVVAGYLVHNLNGDWTKGAAYFEEKLIDYSPASNWGNWAFIAGVGNDPKENKYFSAARAASELETTNAFIDTWLPEHDANTAAV